MVSFVSALIAFLAGCTSADRKDPTMPIDDQRSIRFQTAHLSHNPKLANQRPVPDTPHISAYLSGSTDLLGGRSHRSLWHEWPLVSVDEVRQTAVGP